MSAYEIILDPRAFLATIGTWQNEPQLWLDTEVADWFTKTPRLSLLQVRNGQGRTWIVDVLEAGMQQVVEQHFIPQVMANPQVEKWAHYARFERKFLGQDRVINLNCTFETARSIPYYRLPLRSLSLAALAEHFFGVKLDKTYQKADWGARPLSQEQLAYAASDTEWCRRIYDELQKIPRPPAVSDDDPAAIARCYIELLAPLKDARLFREDIRAAVKEFMIAKNVHRLSRFEVHTSTAHSTDLRTLAQFALTTDPGGYFDLRINLSHKILSVLGPEARAQMQHGAEIGVTQTFRGPRGPRSRDRPAATYALNPLDAGELTSDYETADHNVSVLTSERDELRQRMKLWMQAQGLHAWGDFSFSAPRERWKVDVRAIADGTIREPIQIAFPQRLRLAFGESELEQLIASGVTKEVPVLRWLPRALSVGPEAQQSRDWSDGTDTTQAGEE